MLMVGMMVVAAGWVGGGTCLGIKLVERKQRYATPSATNAGGGLREPLFCLVAEPEAGP